MKNIFGQPLETKAAVFTGAQLYSVENNNIYARSLLE